MGTAKLNINIVSTLIKKGGFGLMLKNYERHILWLGVCIILFVVLAYSAIFLSEPPIPKNVIIWGFIGAATYVSKTVAGHIGKGTFDDQFIPFHVSRLAIGPALAVIVYFILSTGSLLGMTFRPEGDNLHVSYAYSAIAFMSGYFVRHVTDSLSVILDSLLKTK